MVTKKAAVKNPIDAYLSEKNAGFFDSVGKGFKQEAQNFGTAGLGSELFRRGVGSALAVGGALATTTAAAGASKLYNAATKSRDFKKMLDHNPDLAESHKENPKQFNQMFSTLRMFNPAFSRDPIVAGTYMRQMTQNPLTAGSLAVEALGHTGSLPPSPTAALLMAGMKASPIDPMVPGRAAFERARMEHDLSQMKEHRDLGDLRQQSTRARMQGEIADAKHKERYRNEREQLDEWKLHEDLMRHSPYRP